jgi:DNA-binding XRE family transcriptional regulator
MIAHRTALRNRRGCSDAVLSLVCRSLVFNCATLNVMVSNNLAKRVGILIRRIRTDKELSQEDLANRCGLHRTYIGSIERGEKTITIETAYKITRSLDMTLSQFFKLLEETS